MSATDEGSNAGTRSAATRRVAAPSGAMAGNWWVPVMVLASFSFLLHFLWEMLQVPLHAGMAGMAHWSGVVVCAKATAGDVAIALAAYVTAAGFARARHWRASRVRVATYLAVGVAITLVLEWLNVYVWHRWAYSTAMPLVLGIGISPLLQWVIVPPLALWLMQRHVAADAMPAVGDTSGMAGMKGMEGLQSMMDSTMGGMSGEMHAHIDEHDERVG